MDDIEDFSHLSDSWLYWGRLAGLNNVQSPKTHQADELRFTSDDYSVHVRHRDESWILDTVDERGELHTDTAEFSTFSLVEKFLIWDWASTARGAMRLPRLEPKLYALGMNPNITATPLKVGIYKLQSREGWAVLMEPSATIFSHLMSRPLNEIEERFSQDI